MVTGVVSHEGREMRECRISREGVVFGEVSLGGGELRGAGVSHSGDVIESAFEGEGLEDVLRGGWKRERVLGPTVRGRLPRVPGGTRLRRV